MPGDDGVLVSMEGEYAFLDVYSGGRVSWTQCKATLTPKAIWLKDTSGKRAIPLSSITVIGRDISSRIKRVFEEYISIAYLDKNGEEKILVLSGTTHKELQKFRSYLTYTQARRMKVLMLHPAKIGGVIQSDSKWRKALLGIKRKTDEEGNIIDTIIVKPEKGESVVIPVDKIEKFSSEIQSIGNSNKEVITIRYTYNGENYSTYIYTKTANRLREYLTECLHDSGIVPKRSADSMVVEGKYRGPSFSQIEEKILVALYSGVGSMEIDSFVEGIDDVDALEEIYDRMIADGLLEVVRIRKEVELTPKGKGIVNLKMEIKDEDGKSTF
ncbi:MAG: protein containing DUF439 [Candidatus Syntrophoarchaeum caldarius]|uniref:Protein containing DUF439 n=1 Tax=Candidatus Syntropharchaeum caldarium TaxID=1838285 RepID=A0A1F2PA90_9EURY|nr:MAG: protein containing DUF439 [Candidatus Syntrophoarchaeum caldarius]